MKKPGKLSLAFYLQALLVFTIEIILHLVNSVILKTISLGKVAL